MTGLSVLIVDDEPIARRRVARLLAKVDWVKQVNIATDFAEAILMVNTTQPDIMLLDIQMPGGSGFDVLTSLEIEMPVIVFVTAFDHYALRAFKANAVDYLTKPIEPGRFNVAMEKARLTATQRLQAEKIAELQETLISLKRAINDQTIWVSEFWVKTRGEHLRIDADSIIRFQAERDYVRIYTLNSNYLYPESLSSLQQKLDPLVFIRIHRSNIVCRKKIIRIKHSHFSSLIVILTDATEVRVGRTYASVVRMSLQ